MHGFGHGAFGERTFGEVDWARVVLWEELPEDKKQEDLDEGGKYYDFVTSLMPSFNELKTLIYKSHEHLIDPDTVRIDLLNYVARNFGITLDLAEPEAYQRTQVEIAGRWRLIKGTDTSYEILCAIHGFNVEVKEMWWNGSTYTETGPEVTNEVVGVVP